MTFSPSWMMTWLPGWARPASTASPLGVTRTTSKLSSAAVPASPAGLVRPLSVSGRDAAASPGAVRRSSLMPPTSGAFACGASPLSVDAGVAGFVSSVRGAGWVAAVSAGAAVNRSGGAPSSSSSSRSKKLRPMAPTTTMTPMPMTTSARITFLPRCNKMFRIFTDRLQDSTFGTMGIAARDSNARAHRLGVSRPDFRRRGHFADSIRLLRGGSERR